MKITTILAYLLLIFSQCHAHYHSKRKWLRKINRIQLSNQSTDTVGTFKLPEISVSAVEVTKAINGLLFNSPTQSRTRVLSPSLINLDTKGSATDGSSLLSGSIFSINRRNDSLISLKDLQQRDPLGLDLLQPFLNLYLQGAEEKLQESVKQRLTDLFNRKLFNRIQIAKGSATQRDVEFLTDWHETLQKSSYLRHYWRSRYKRELKLTGNQIELLTAFNSSRSFEEAVRTGLIYQEPIILDPVQASEPDILTLVIESPVILSPYLLGPYVLAPLVLSPHILSPAVLGPEILSPLVLTPFVLSPQVLSPAVLGPSVLSPFILSPEVLGPNVLSPTVLSPCVLSPKVLGGEVLSPSALSPFILCPSVLSADVLSEGILSEKILSGGGGEPELNGTETNVNSTDTTIHPATLGVEAGANATTIQPTNIPITTENATITYNSSTEYTSTSNSTTDPLKSTTGYTDTSDSTTIAYNSTLEPAGTSGYTTAAYNSTTKYSATSDYSTIVSYNSTESAFPTFENSTGVHPNGTVDGNSTDLISIVSKITSIKLNGSD